MARILVIIISYNSEKWIRKNLNSLLSQNIVVDILLIDNNSQDLTLSIVKQEYPQIRVIELKENIGFARANNIGFEIAKSEHFEYVFLLNHDAWLDINCLENLVGACIDNNILLASPVHLNGLGNNFDHGFQKYFPSLKFETFKDLISPILYVNKITGAFMLINCKLLFEFIGFNPIYEFYGEDDDFCARVNKKYPIAIVINSLAYHDRENRKDNTYRVFNYMKASYMFQLFHSDNSFFLFKYLKVIYGICSKFKVNGFKMTLFLLNYFVFNFFKLIKNYCLYK